MKDAPEFGRSPLRQWEVSLRKGGSELEEILFHMFSGGVSFDDARPNRFRAKWHMFKYGIGHHLLQVIPFIFTTLYFFTTSRITLKIFLKQSRITLGSYE